MYFSAVCSRLSIFNKLLNIFSDIMLWNLSFWWISVNILISLIWVKFTWNYIFQKPLDQNKSKLAEMVLFQNCLTSNSVTVIKNRMWCYSGYWRIFQIIFFFFPLKRNTTLKKISCLRLLDIFCGVDTCLLVKWVWKNIQQTSKFN